MFFNLVHTISLNLNFCFVATRTMLEHMRRCFRSFLFLCACTRSLFCRVGPRGTPSNDRVSVELQKASKKMLLHFYCFKKSWCEKSARWVSRDLKKLWYSNSWNNWEKLQSKPAKMQLGEINNTRSEERPRMRNPSNFKSCDVRSQFYVSWLRNWVKPHQHSLIFFSFCFYRRDAHDKYVENPSTRESEINGIDTRERSWKPPYDGRRRTAILVPDSQCCLDAMSFVQMPSNECFISVLDRRVSRLTEKICVYPETPRKLPQIV